MFHKLQLANSITIQHLAGHTAKSLQGVNGNSHMSLRSLDCVILIALLHTKSQLTITWNVRSASPTVVFESLPVLLLWYDYRTCLLRDQCIGLLHWPAPEGLVVVLLVPSE